MQFTKGQHVKVKRSSGEVEPGWVIHHMSDNPYKAPEISPVVVVKPLGDGDGEALFKVVTLGDLFKWNTSVAPPVHTHDGCFLARWVYGTCPPEETP